MCGWSARIPLARPVQSDPALMPRAASEHSFLCSWAFLPCRQKNKNIPCDKGRGCAAGGVQKDRRGSEDARRKRWDGPCQGTLLLASRGRRRVVRPRLEPDSVPGSLKLPACGDAPSSVCAGRAGTGQRGERSVSSPVARLATAWAGSSVLVCRPAKGLAPARLVLPPAPLHLEVVHHC